MRKITFTPIAALLLLATSAVQANPDLPSTLETIWQWLLPQPSQPELKTCPSYPECYGPYAPRPEPQPTTKK